MHPGGIVTGLAKHIPVDQLKAAGNLDGNGEPVIDPERDMKSIPQGAATHVWCAVSPLLDGKGGVFCANLDIAPLFEGDEPPPCGVAPYAVDPVSAERLWEVSEAMTAATLR